MTDKPGPDFEDLTAAALDNAGIVTADCLRAARVATETVAAAPIRPSDCPRLANAKQDEIVYEITMELLDTGLMPGLVPNGPVGPIAQPPDNDAATVSSPRQYPTRVSRSVVSNQPYDTYAPRIQFLQLGEVRAHRSALSAATEMRARRSALSPLFNLETQHDGRSARNWMKRV